VTNTPAYEVHETRTADGTRVREFVNPGGFAGEHHRLPDPRPPPRGHGIDRAAHPPRGPLAVGGDQLFTSTPSATVYPTLGAPLGALQLSSSTFDWGLPFFLGRSVFVLFETRSAGSTTGPAVGF
jgi:uncharacterized protein DUF3443